MTRRHSGCHLMLCSGTQNHITEPFREMTATNMRLGFRRRTGCCQCSTVHITESWLSTALLLHPSGIEVDRHGDDVKQICSYLLLLMFLLFLLLLFLLFLLLFLLLLLLFSTETFLALLSSLSPSGFRNALRSLAGFKETAIQGY